MITYIETTQDADRACAELEDARHVVINAHIEARQLGWQDRWHDASLRTEAADEASATVRALEVLLIKWSARPCRGSADQCHHMVRADDQCRTAALPHEAKCDEHLVGESRWADSHEQDDCCGAHCDGAEHAVDSIVTKEAA